jgi:hypothetical protein
MDTLLNGQVRRSPVYQNVLKPPIRRPVEPTYGIVLLDRQGNLVGASTAGSLPGEVEMPRGVNLREQDLRSYLCEVRGFPRGRHFPLVTATWVQVKSTRVRVGVYMESGDWGVSPEGLEPDLSSIAAILSAQVA